MEHYRIRISSSEIEISSHDKTWTEKKEKEYAKNIKDLLQPSNEPKEKRERGGSKSKGLGSTMAGMSIQEFYRRFIHEAKIKSRPDIATFFVYFLQKIEKSEEISPNDVKEQFKKVGYPSWNKINISDVLSKARTKALLNSLNNSWSLTISGEDYVLNALSAVNA